MTMVLVDLLVVIGGVSLSRPFLALGRELGVGVGVDLLAASILLLVMPTLENHPHAYTAFLASMLVVYRLTSQLDGSGAMAVLTAALLLGNASLLVPRLIRAKATLTPPAAVAPLVTPVPAHICHTRTLATPGATAQSKNARSSFSGGIDGRPVFGYSRANSGESSRSTVSTISRMGRSA